MMQAAVEIKMKGPFDWKSLLRVLAKACKEENHHEEITIGSKFGLSKIAASTKRKKSSNAL